MRYRDVERAAFKVGEVGQWAGMLASLSGLVVELTMRADIGYVMLTIGSLVWAAATKIKYYRARGGTRRASHR